MMDVDQSELTACIAVSRKRELRGAGRRLSIYVDGRLCSRLSTGQTTIIRVSDGKHNVSAQISSKKRGNTLTVDTASGSTEHLRISINANSERYGSAVGESGWVEVQAADTPSIESDRLTLRLSIVLAFVFLLLMAFVAFLPSSPLRTTGSVILAALIILSLPLAVRIVRRQ